MGILDLEGKRTPVPSKPYEPNLISVSRKLRENPTPRDYTSIPEPKLILSSLSGPCTPPPIDPLHPLQYFRDLSHTTLQTLQHGRTKLDYRASIEDPVYWIIEVKFFSQDMPDYEDQRQKIENSYYWRCEANYWRSVREEHIQGDRFSIADCTYWRIELELMAHKMRLEERRKIPDVHYWQIEQWHYHDQLQLQRMRSIVLDLTTPRISPTPTQLHSPQPSSTSRPSLKRRRAATEADDATPSNPPRNMRRKLKLGVSYYRTRLKKPKKAIDGVGDDEQNREDGGMGRRRRRSPARFSNNILTRWSDGQASQTTEIAETPPSTE